ncbi:unnamed protein product [Adineta steineri]|uniref:Uncharacterized protein n=1 Tax=Adineta steineri TaxID=433720 RepID=A0A814LDE0_9BILA|nr:unnamed protein product [Adineta steineri]CAF3632294.1 unnamed protein product [Adineta steineri]
MKIVLANGTLVKCTPLSNDQYSEVFFGSIGGYGGLGVIVEVTLQLTDNLRLERMTRLMSLNEYEIFFRQHIRHNESVKLHNANVELLPHAISMWQRIPGKTGHWLRHHVIDPLFHYKANALVVTSQNYEITYTIYDLEPMTRLLRTYGLQEYFVPPANLKSFTVAMLQIFRNQLTTIDAQAEVGQWTRELIDLAVTKNDGTYYLPYQMHATREQFYKAYPRVNQWLELKKHLDPENIFRNMFWQKYGQNSMNEEKKVVQ